MPFFGNIRKSKKNKLIDYSSLKVDFHSHLIPNIDDGSKSYELSLELIRRMSGLGFKKLITTPHVMNDYCQNSPESIKLGLEKLRWEIEQVGIPIEIEAAAEYMVDDGFEAKLRNNEFLTFGNNYLLIELSSLSPPYNLKELLFDLQIEGYKIILAHPERYTYWMNDFKNFEELKNRNVFFQMNTVSLSGFYPEPTRKFAIKLIDANMIDFLGSDMHNLKYLRALELALDDKNLQKILSAGQLLNHTLL